MNSQKLITYAEQIIGNISKREAASNLSLTPLECTREHVLI